MISGALKTVLFTALAILLSAGHSVCAGMIAKAAPTVQHQQIASSYHDGHGSHDMSQHDHAPDKQKPAPCGPNRDDCQHCKAAQFYKAPVKSEFAGSVSYAPIEKSLFVSSNSNGQSISTNTDWALKRRRGPPGETPISLKNRLLI